ncbi:unnamed protein product [Fusarium fujikuroi]|nr:unnamed protein product [Fusarium fujikuroi]
MLYYRTTARAFHRPVRDQGKLSSLHCYLQSNVCLLLVSGDSDLQEWREK